LATDAILSWSSVFFSVLFIYYLGNCLCVAYMIVLQFYLSNRLYTDKKKGVNVARNKKWQLIGNVYENKRKND